MLNRSHYSGQSCIGYVHTVCFCVCVSVCVQGIQFLIENELLKNTCDDIAQFLYKGEGLNKTAIGDYLGERSVRPMLLLLLLLLLLCVSMCVCMYICGARAKRSMLFF